MQYRALETRPAVSAARLTLLLLCLLPTAATAQAGLPAETDAPADAPEAARPELLWEFDPYYSSAAWLLPLTDSPLPDGGPLPEVEVYRRLLHDSLRPRLLMLEASVYPLPAAGTWLKKHEPALYEDFNVGTAGSNQLNLIDAVTTGFQEPWALSLFAGSSMRFSAGGGASAGGRNRGYMGYLVSFGGKHIRNNVLIDDNWWELEWKLKGERDSELETLDWSFRLGLKTHGHPDIRDVAYLGLRRSNLDYGASWLSLLRNSEITLLTEVGQHGGRLLRQEVILGRKLPLRRYRVALTLEAGLVYESPAKYRGHLADPSADSLNFVLRPNLEF